MTDCCETVLIGSQQSFLHRFILVYSSIGFLSDGGTPLKIYENGKAVSRVFPVGTIVIDKFMLRDSEKNRCRFTLAHEAAHFILARMQSPVCRASYHMEFDSEHAYSRKEIMKLLSSTEYQADMLASALLKDRKTEHLSVYSGKFSLILFQM